MNQVNTGCPRNKSPLKFICGRGCASSMEIRITSREDNVYMSTNHEQLLRGAFPENGVVAAASKNLMINFG